MNTALVKLMPALAVLDRVDRNIIRYYLDELDEAENGDPLDEKDDPDFVAEIERRIESIRNGTAKMIPADEVFRQADLLLESMRQRKP